MDILNKALDLIQSELGDDIFTDEKRELFERQFRFDHGGDRHYIASANAMAVTQKHQEVRRLIRQGLGNTAISERIGITRQQVWNIRQGMTSSTLP